MPVPFDESVSPLNDVPVEPPSNTTPLPVKFLIAKLMPERPIASTLLPMTSPSAAPAAEPSIVRAFVVPAKANAVFDFASVGNCD